MVSYTEWTSIVFDLAGDRRGVTQQEIISWAAKRWNERKSDLKAASREEARRWASKKL